MWEVSKILGLILLVLLYLLVLIVGIVAAHRFKAKHRYIRNDNTAAAEEEGMNGDSQVETNVVAGRSLSSTVGIFTMTG